jgi:hypothetical protein
VVTVLLLQAAPASAKKKLIKMSFGIVASSRPAIARDVPPEVPGFCDGGAIESIVALGSIRSHPRSGRSFARAR